MKTKEEAIKDAYGDRFEDLKSFICMHDGWCQDRQYNQIDCPRPVDYNSAITEYIRADNGERTVDVFRWMPKELEGIGDNNGWIAIDNKIKVDNSKYWVRFFNPDTNIESFEVINVLNGVIDYYFATHYQPIIKPLKPLY